MNNITRSIFRAIHEGRWLSIEYKNQQTQQTKYWVAIRGLNPRTRTLNVDGLHLAAELRKEDQHTLLIFVTNHDELVFQCFQYEVFNFIRKDFLESELPLAVASAYQKVWNHTSKLQLKSKTGLLSLAADDVVYFVSENHTIMMCEKENTKVQVMYTMEKLEKLLPQNQFVRCHAGYIVNCFYVFSINPNEILLTTGERIPLSRHRKKEMKSVFQQYLRGI